MARMIPRTIHSSVRSGAERRLFNILSREPNTRDWVCLHSLGLARHPTKRRAEIDFLLVTPHGAFAIEVKGGRVRRDQGMWVFTDRYGVDHHKAEGPVEQAAGAMFALESSVREHFRDKPLSQTLFGYGVAFPDIEFDAIGCDIDPALVYDVRDRGKPFAAYIRRLAEFSRQQQSLPRRGLKAEKLQELVDFLRRDFDIVPTLDVIVEDTRRQLASLTEEQALVLDALGAQTRLLIEGPAGLGKTIIAVEAARREARVGHRVLFLCYNKMLTEKIGAAIEDEQYVGSITLRTVYSHFKHLIEESTFREEFAQLANVTPEGELFGRLYSEYAGLAALEEVEPRYDKLFIDEAQDILIEANIQVLNELVRGGLSDGGWWFFLDSNNQACVYDKLDETALKRLGSMAPTQLLTLNCRNTRPIAMHTNVVAQPEVRSQGRVDGPPVQFRPYEQYSGVIDIIASILAELRKQGLSPGNISVLFPRMPNSNVQKELGKAGLKRLAMKDVSALGTSTLTAVTWSSVSGFKGLENDVVVLVGVEDIEKPWWRAVTYVGMSRARSSLYVIIKGTCEPIRSVRLEREVKRRLSSGELLT